MIGREVERTGKLPRHGVGVIIAPLSATALAADGGRLPSPRTVHCGLPPTSNPPRSVWFTVRWNGLHSFDLLLGDDPLVAIHRALDTVLRLVSNQREQPHNNERPMRYKRMRPAKRCHNSLPHLEAVVRHPVYMV